MRSDVMITGTGSLAEACLYAFSGVNIGQPLRLAIAGRSRERLAWLALASNGRAVSYGTPNFTEALELDWSVEALARTLAAAKPKVIIQTASMQSPWTLGRANAWARMIGAGGYGLATPLHTILTARLIEAVQRQGLDTVIINGAFPDIANSIIQCMGLPAPTGFGNIDLVAVCALALNGGRHQESVQVLGQYEPHCAAFRLPPTERGGMSPRVWIDGKELADVQERLACVRFPASSDDALNQLTGPTVVPFALAYLDGRAYVGHVCGPFGLPGGYPVRITGRKMSLRLPQGVTQDEAVRYNKRLEEAGGIVLDEQAKRIRLTGKAHSALHRHSPALAKGYSVASLAELEAAGRDLIALREGLELQPAA